MPKGKFPALKVVIVGDDGSERLLVPTVGRRVLLLIRTGMSHSDLRTKLQNETGGLIRSHG